MNFSTWVEIDLEVFLGNLEAIRGMVGGRTGILLVVKADAYGHGAARLALAAEPHVAQFGVATLHEGLELRGAGVRRPILILSPTMQGEIDEILDAALTPSLGALSYARALSRAACERGIEAPYQVEIDTGMGRAGVLEKDACEFLQQAASLPGLRLDGAYMHFPESDSDDLGFSRDQLRRFLAVAHEARSRGVVIPALHAANSAALVRLPEARLDLVRPGILAYGHLPRVSLPLPPGVRPVMSMKSRLAQVRDLPAGATVSYDRTFTARRPSRIGVVPAGYGHGLSWLLSNNGFMLVRGQRVPIVGNVTMDITLVDVTDVPGVQAEDEVVIFGRQGAETLPAEELAARSGTLVYEVLCTLGKRVVRVYRRGALADQITTLVGERSVVLEPGEDRLKVKYSRLPRGGRREAR